MKLPVWAWIVIGVLGLGAIGCAADSKGDKAVVADTSNEIDNSVAANTGTTAPVEAVAATLPPTTLPPTTLPPTTLPPTTLPPTTLASNPFGGHAPEDFLMPAVVCMTLQQAQDEIQDHGVFFSGSEDATGEGRMQLNDSNWQVVAQSPEPGTPIGEFDALLYVVKFGEQPNPC